MWSCTCPGRPPKRHKRLRAVKGAHARCIFRSAFINRILDFGPELTVTVTVAQRNSCAGGESLSIVKRRLIMQCLKLMRDIKAAKEGSSSSSSNGKQRRLQSFDWRCGALLSASLDLKQGNRCQISSTEWFRRFHPCVRRAGLIQGGDRPLQSIVKPVNVGFLRDDVTYTKSASRLACGGRATSARRLACTLHAAHCVKCKLKVAGKRLRAGK